VSSLKNILFLLLSLAIFVLHTIAFIYALTPYLRDDTFSNTLVLISVVLIFLGALFSSMIEVTHTFLTTKLFKKIPLNRYIKLFNIKIAMRVFSNISFLGILLLILINGYSASLHFNVGDNDAGLWAGVAFITLGLAEIIFTLSSVSKK